MDGEGVSAAATEVLVQNLINILKEEGSVLREFDEGAQPLQTTLKTIQRFLNDAEKKSITNKAVQIWLRELEALAFDFDNYLDVLSYQLLHNKMETEKTPTEMETEKAAMPLRKKMGTEVLSVFSSLNPISRRQLKKINTSFENMNKRATQLGLQVQSTVVNAPAADADAALNASDSSLDPIFIGKDDDVPKLVEILTQTHAQERIFSILALVGEEGMGKTTLIRKVFNHEKMKARFGSHIWVDASQTFDPIIIFNKILSTLTTSHTGGGVEIREVILIKLQEALKSKTYLLVLDDVWNEDVSKWEDFINWLSAVSSTTGNGIIITTRHEKVASIMNPLHIHLLKRLSDGDCWSIIKAKAFEEGEASSVFETIGKEIANRCQGSALAANLVGGVLRCKSEEAWRAVQQKWLPDDDISKILRLSYDNLSSPSLKKCFTYCSIFPKGHRIVKQELIELWMAEGFLQPNGENDMESVGDKFFNILVQNSLLQVAERDSYGNVESCVMHDLVHKMASSVLGSSNDADGGTQSRYVILKEEESGIPKEVAKSAKHLRTLFLEGEMHSVNMFSDFQSLRNLTLTRVEELPDSIRKLIHLRNLNISKSWIRELPESIGELRHLQTLRAYTKHLWELPSELKYLTKLRHLYIFSHVKLPAMMGRLTCLQTLRHFAVGGDKGYKIEELGTMINLKGEVRISNLEKVNGKEEAEKANICMKPNLSELVLEWSAYREGETNDESVLLGLRPHANLKKLEIRGFKGKTFPEWTQQMALNNLIEVTLSRCSECEQIPELEHLPNLKSLSLIGLKKVRFINSSFSKLMSLNIQDLEELGCLPDWLFSNNPNLSKLWISRCPKLRELPKGVGSLNSLEELSIRDCRNLMWIGLSQGMLPSLKLEIEGCGRTVEEFSGDASEKLQPSDIKDCPELHSHSDWPNEFTYNGTSSAAIKVLLQNIINDLKVAPIRDLDAQLLQKTVGYLNDAEKKSITQGAVKNWLRMLEVVAFDADDVLDERSYHLLHKKVNKMKTLKDKVLSSLNHISSRRNMAHRVRKII